MISKDSIRIAVTMKRDQLKVLDEFIKNVNKTSAITYTRSSMLVTAFFALVSQSIEEAKQKQKEEEK